MSGVGVMLGNALSLACVCVLGPVAEVAGAQVRALAWGETAPPLAAARRNTARAMMMRGHPTAASVAVVVAALSSLAVVLWPARADLVLGALLLLGGRALLWRGAGCDPVLAFAQTREQRGAMAALFLIGAAVFVDNRQAGAAIGDVLLALAVLCALLTGPLMPRDPLPGACPDPDAASVAAGLCRAGWAVWLVKLAWPGAGETGAGAAGIWGALLSGPVCLCAGSLAIALAQGLWLPRVAARPLAPGVLLGGGALLLLAMGRGLS